MGGFTIPFSVTPINNSSPAGVPASGGPWRPPQWNQTQLYSLTAQLPSQTATVTTSAITNGQPDDAASGSTSETTTPAPTTYFFDAILRVEHQQDLVPTRHPIQTGASLVDHAYLQPSRVTLEIGISDAMAQFSQNQFSGNPSKSVSAYQTVLNLQKLRIPLSLSTRLLQYSNLLIESVRAVEDNKTRFSSRFSVTFCQIIVAFVGTNTVSARPDQTNTTNEGTKQPNPIPPDVQNLLNTFPGTTFHKN